MTKRSLRRALRGTEGFTLIELLVVIVIIGILATGAVGVFSNTQKQARDAVRKGDLKTMQSSIELYKADGSGDAPDVTASTLTAELVPNYLQALPVDPANTDHTYEYVRDDEGGTTTDPTLFKIFGDDEKNAVESGIFFGAADDTADSDCTDGDTTTCTGAGDQVEEFGE